MQFEWDEAKDRANRAKHGIGFDRAVRVFEGDYVTALIGVLDEVLIVSVIHTDRHGVTRIISARPAKRKERKFYDGQNRKGQT